MKSNIHILTKEDVSNLDRFTIKFYINVYDRYRTKVYEKLIYFEHHPNF